MVSVVLLQIGKQDIHLIVSSMSLWIIIVQPLYRYSQVFRKDLSWGLNLLFILYINDFVNVSKEAELLLFAGDTNLFLYDTDIYQLSVRANKAFSDTSNWFKMNKYSVNLKNVILYYSLQDQLQPILK